MRFPGPFAALGPGQVITARRMAIENEVIPGYSGVSGPRVTQRFIFDGVTLTTGSTVTGQHLIGVSDPQ
jgi:hypothetical protein